MWWSRATGSPLSAPARRRPPTSPAPNEADSLADELRQAVYLARLRGGPQALSVREALEMATIGGAEIIGREGDLGSIEVGKLAYLALWRLDTRAHADIADPVAALVLGVRPPPELLLVDGRPIVEHDAVVTVGEDTLAQRSEKAHRDLVRRAG